MLNATFLAKHQCKRNKAKIKITKGESVALPQRITNGVHVLQGSAMMLAGFVALIRLEFLLFTVQ